MRFTPWLLLLLLSGSFVFAEPAIILRPSKLEMGEGTLRIDKTNEFRLDATNITR